MVTKKGLSFELELQDTLVEGEIIIRNNIIINLTRNKKPYKLFMFNPKVIFSITVIYFFFNWFT